MRRIGGIILAAGGSTRLGEPKQLLEFNGETLVHAAVRAALAGGCDVVCVVTGHAPEAVEESVADLSPQLVHNADWQRGIGSSLRLGLSCIQPVSATVVLACDQPAVTADIVRALIDLHDRTRREVIASLYSGTLGIPVLFGQSCFAELQGLPDDRGAKAVIRADPTRVAVFDFHEGSFDLDSQEHLEAWRQRLAQRDLIRQSGPPREPPTSAAARRNDLSNRVSRAHQPKEVIHARP
jgi:molybdenum cofactor cytidylyltransferase